MYALKLVKNSKWMVWACDHINLCFHIALDLAYTAEYFQNGHNIYHIFLSTLLTFYCLDPTKNNSILNQVNRKNNYDAVISLSTCYSIIVIVF